MTKIQITLCLLIAILSSASVFPVILGNPNDLLCVSKVDARNRDFCLLVSTTTSLPTLVIQGVELESDSAEIKERIQAELNEDVEPVLLLELAEQNEMSLQELKLKLRGAH